MAVQMTELDHIPGEELTHIPGEELTHIPGEELTHEPGLPLGYAPKWLLDELGLGHYYDPALTVDLNPLPPTVPHAPKTLPDPPPKKSQLPVPIVEHPNVKSQLPVPIEEPLAVASHLPVSLPEPAAKKSQLPVAMPGVVGTEAERRAIGAPSKPRVSRSAARGKEVEKKAIPTKPRSQKGSPSEPSKVVSRLPVPIPEPEVTKSHLPVPLPEPAAKKSQLPVAMPGVVGTEAERRAVGRAQPPPAVFWSTPSEPTSLADVIARQAPPYSSSYVTVSPQESSEFFDNPGMGFQRSASNGIQSGPDPIGFGSTHIPSKSLYIRVFWSGLVDSNGALAPMKGVMQRIRDAVAQNDCRLSIRIMPYNVAASTAYPMDASIYDQPLASLQANWQTYYSAPSSWDKPVTDPTRGMVMPRVSWNRDWSRWVAHSVHDLNNEYLARARQLISELRDGLKSIIDRVDFIDVGLVGASGEWADTNGLPHPNRQNLLLWREHDVMPGTSPKTKLTQLQKQTAWNILGEFQAQFPDTYLLANVAALVDGHGVYAKIRNSTGALPANVGWRTDHWGTEWNNTSDQSIGGRSSFGGDVYRTSLTDGLNNAHPESPVALEVGSTTSSEQKDFPSLIAVNTKCTTASLAEQVTWSVDQALNARASYIYLKSYNLLIRAKDWLGHASAPSPDLADATQHMLFKGELSRLALHLGYRLVVTRCWVQSYSSQRYPALAPLRVQFEVTNRGVARCYGAGPGRPYEFVLKLVHERSGAASYFATGHLANEVEPSTMELTTVNSNAQNEVVPVATPPQYVGYYLGSKHPLNGSQILKQWHDGPALIRAAQIVTPGQAGKYWLFIGVAMASSGGTWHAPVRLANTDAEQHPDGWWLPISNMEVS